MWITSLKDNEIFVFGANMAGRCGKGAALVVYKKFGAILGQGDGLQGQSYAITTKDKNLKTLPLSAIAVNVARFIKFAESRPDLVFLVTPIGCGLAGYKPKQIAPMFKDVPENVILPKEFKLEMLEERLRNCGGIKFNDELA